MPADILTCNCSEEDGPCELHADFLVVREGASLRTADELSRTFCDDAVSLGAEPSVWARSVLDADGAWLEDERDHPMPGECYSDYCRNQGRCGASGRFVSTH